MNATARILLAEDEEIIAIIIQDILAEEGMQVDVYADGQSAWERLQADPDAYDAVLLDREMPGLNGSELLCRIKQAPALADIPVIMETALGDEQSVREGLAQGAYYYLTKPFQPAVLAAVVNAALEQSRNYRDLAESVRGVERPLALMQKGSFRFRDLDESRLLANYLALTCPEPERTIQGLQELLVNAVEHGNLGISYDAKSSLVRDGNWQQEVERRLQLPEYRDRYVSVEFLRTAQSLVFTISDQGEGFDWKAYLDFSPERAFDLHGRGIALAGKMSFDALEYQGNGNTVVVSVALDGGNSCQGH